MSPNNALLEVLATLVEAIKAAGPQGTPEGPMYAHLMAYGCTLNQFNALIGCLVKMGKITKDGFILRAV